MADNDIFSELDELKSAIKANPKAVELAGSRLREILAIARAELNVEDFAVNPAGYCHSHCGSHCISHPQGRLGSKILTQRLAGLRSG